MTNAFLIDDKNFLLKSPALDVVPLVINFQMYVLFFYIKIKQTIGKLYLCMDFVTLSPEPLFLILNAKPPSIK